MFDENGNYIDLNKLDKDKIYPLSFNNNNNNNNYNELKQFIWNINDFETMNKIKSAKIGECVTSEFINIYGYEWSLSFYGSGKNEKEKYESKLYVNLKLLPNNINGISFYFEIYINETNSSFNNYAHFRNDYLMRSWETTRIKISQLQNLNKLTFTLKLKIVDVFYSE